MKNHVRKISTKDSNSKVDNVVLKGNRENAIMNTIANTSIILMSTMMGAFTHAIVNVTDSMASGIAEVMGGKEAADKISGETRRNLPDVDQKTKAMISDIRKDIYLQLKQKKQEMAPFLSDPAFDVGPKIISEYDFNLPKLTEELDDKALVKYSKLLTAEDTRFAQMFKALTEWLSTLPKPPEADNQK